MRLYVLLAGLPAGLAAFTGCDNGAMSPAPITTVDEHHVDFPLTGGHKPVACVSCHAGSEFVAVDPTCIACHAADFRQDGVLLHRQLEGATRDCLLCHQTSAWKDSAFDHTATAFALRGAHAETACIDCHRPSPEDQSVQFLSLETDCVNCHANDFQEADEPNHVLLDFPKDCLQCHNQNDWEPAAFDHSQFDFALNGAHQQVACSSCHIDGVFDGTPTDCVSCHADDFRQADDPIHTEGSFSAQCLECHTEAAWEPSFFDHGNTGFALNGAHRQTDCASCHTDGAYAGTPTNCIDCHAEDFREADEPNHVLLDFPKDCLQCHNQNDWEPAAFDHSQFDFALNGAHQQVACSSCHIDGVFDGTPTDCVSCHADDFRQADDPIHTEGSFSAQCLECHTEAAWEPSFFDHGNTGFALNGAHRQTDCASCHTDGAYAGTPIDCVSCHARDEPRNHFGPDCAACHTETAWTPSTFDHERYFPLRRGEHRIYRNDCQACHLDPSSYSFFSCIDCHDGEHQKRDMDDEHRGVRGYRYESNACYECHPDGND